MNHNEQFREHAITDRQAAEDTPLANVREKLLRSAAAWDGMAVRQDALTAAREKRALDKLALDAEQQPSAAPES